jgi:hypothetical protein
MNTKHRLCLPSQLGTGRRRSPGAVVALLVLGNLLPFVALDASGAADDAVTVEQILAAWKNRQEGIRSFQYECDMESSKVIVPSLQMPDPDAPIKRVTLRNSIVLTVVGEKMAFVKEGEWWDFGTNVKMKTGRQTLVFDGTRGMQLFEGTPVPLAQESGHEMASDVLLRDLQLTPFWVVHSTLRMLVQYHFDLDKMRITRRDAFHDGHDCIEVAVPLGDLPGLPAGVKLPDHRVQILVDPARDYLPLRYRRLVAGDLLYETTIVYVFDDRSGWVASEFHASIFDFPKKAATSSWRIDVRRRSINAEISDSTFTRKIPVGTHVVEDDGPVFSGRQGGNRRFAVQMPDGTRRSIPEHEYGWLPPLNTL